jgi:uncharacterized repeat protein (TIGR03803 family)
MKAGAQIAMKPIILKQLLLLVSVAVLGCSHAAAQIFSSLHGFAHDDSDGGEPFAGLVSSGNTLYGTTYLGGTNGFGTVFAINTDGTSLTTLHSFSAFVGPNYTNGDGSWPVAGLVLSSNTLYGAAQFGGTIGAGTVFKINTDGTGFTNLYSFNPFNMDDGADPKAGLVLSGNTLYGTTRDGGANGNGTVFAINADGAGFTNLYNFTALNSGTNGDGASPVAALVLSGNTLYGTALNGGTNGSGTVFAINIDGMVFTNLHNFTYGSDGRNPYAGLILSGNTLYGTTYSGGTNGFGTIFAINTDGTGFTTLYSFNPHNCYDGAYPYAGLIVSGNSLYGTTWTDGSFGNGTVFAINTDGTGYTNLYIFPGNDGGNPAADLILSGNTLYGTTVFGAYTPSDGTVFALSLGSIPLNVQASRQNQILTWGNPAFSLQSAPALTGQWTTLSNAASPYTVSATNAQSFFRLVYTNSP